MSNPIHFLMIALALSVPVLPLVSSPAALADAISPSIRDTGKVYSTEAPDISYYGNGTGSRAEEAAMLRFDVERALQDARIDDAVAKAKKAIQLDPSVPESHVLLARALSRKFYSKKGPVDEKLLAECLYEWEMLWHHDSDQDDQVEAKAEARRLIRITKSIAKRRKQELIARNEARAEMEKEREKNAGKSKSKIAAKVSVVQESSSSDPTPAGKDNAKSSVPVTGQVAPTEPAATASAQSSNAPAPNTVSQSGAQDTAETAQHKKRFLFF